MRNPNPKALGWVALYVGLLLLTAGVTAYVVLPNWGSWMADYPQMALQQPLPPQVPPELASLRQALLGVVLAPVMEQVGNYMVKAGRFIGSLLTLLSLVPLGAGLGLLARRGE